MEKENQASDTSDKSSFNMSLSILDRINLILTDISMFTAMEFLPEKFKALSSLSGELRSMMDSTMKDEERKFFFKVYEAKHLYLQYYAPYFSRDGELLRYISLNSVVDDQKSYATFFCLLLAYEDYLKDFLEKKGMALAKKKDPKSAASRMS